MAKRDFYFFFYGKEAQAFRETTGLSIDASIPVTSFMVELHRDGWIESHNESPFP